MIRPSAQIKTVPHRYSGALSNHDAANPSTHPLKGLDGDHLTYQQRSREKDT